MDREQFMEDIFMAFSITFPVANEKCKKNQRKATFGVFRHSVCVFVSVAVFVIVFVFLFVLSYDFWIAFIISFQNMYGYRGLWSLRAEIMVIFEVMTDTHTHRLQIHL